MKNITELTEQEILALSQEDINLMIKLAKAEAGIKFIKEPTVPNYIKIPDPDVTVWYIQLLGSSAVFTNRSEVEKIYEQLIASKSLMYSTYEGSDYNLYHIKGTYSDSYSKNFANIETKKVYSLALWNTIKDNADTNKKLKTEYEKDLREYNDNQSSAKDIINNINSKIYEVVKKYNTLNNYVDIFINEYIPLADDIFETAMKFMNKAYTLNEDEIKYITDYYNSPKENIE